MNEYDGSKNRRATPKWEIKKEISIGDLLFFFSGVAVCITAYFSLDKRIAIVEVAIVRQVEIDKAQDVERSVVKNDLHDQLGEIKEKLNWLIEDRNRGQRITPR